MLALRTTVYGFSRSGSKSSTQARAARSLAGKQSAARTNKLRYTTGSGSFRVETDTFGEIKVPADRYWGAQTQRYAVITVANYLFRFSKS